MVSVHALVAILRSYKYRVANYFINLVSAIENCNRFLVCLLQLMQKHKKELLHLICDWLLLLKSIVTKT